ncbi:hypothetical protein F5146DRAFT_1135652 [Armillaria mellea]|nr:hypothetical protein F5146DRAFT_1135652 [Armillaria mellea]
MSDPGFWQGMRRAEVLNRVAKPYATARPRERARLMKAMARVALQTCLEEKLCDLADLTGEDIVYLGTCRHSEVEQRHHVTLPLPTSRREVTYLGTHQSTPQEIRRERRRHQNQHSTQINASDMSIIDVDTRSPSVSPTSSLLNNLLDVDLHSSVSSQSLRGYHLFPSPLLPPGSALLPSNGNGSMDRPYVL